MTMMDYKLLAKASAAGIVVGLLGFSIATILGVGQTGALLITFGALLIGSCGVLMYAQATEEKTLSSAKNPFSGEKTDQDQKTIAPGSKTRAEKKDAPDEAVPVRDHSGLRDRQQQALKTAREVAEELGQISDQLIDDFLFFAGHTDACPKSKSPEDECSCGYEQARARAVSFKS